MAESPRKTGRAFRLEIITPERVVARDDDVEAVVLPAAEGLLGILRNHAPLIGTLNIGVIKYKSGGKFHWVACNQGVFEFRENVLRVLSDTAERGEMIDILRARAARDRALERLQKRPPDLDVLRAELALRRALARIKAATAARGEVTGSDIS